MGGVEDLQVLVGNLGPPQELLERCNILNRVAPQRLELVIDACGWLDLYVLKSRQLSGNGLLFPLERTIGFIWYEAEPMPRMSRYSAREVNMR
jgi:hypothetical protein